jgi:hypothetical protein
VGAAYDFIDLGKARISQQGGPLQGSLQGEYGTNAAYPNLYADISSLTQINRLGFW